MLSVVTITYNNYNDLSSTLESLSVAKDIQSVVVNGGTCLATLKLLKSHFSLSISEPDKGISDAFNKGIRLSTGEFLTFLNSGDLLNDKDYYSKCISIFESRPEIDFIYSDIELISDKYGKILVTPQSKKGKMPFPHPSLVVRKKVFEKVGEFNLDLKVAMDFDLAYKIKEASLTGFYRKGPPVVIMQGGGISSSNDILGLNERLSILKSLKILDIESSKYLYLLYLKSIARKALTFLKLINTYDMLKTYFNKSNKQE